MSNYTEHYQLHQWVAQDPFLRTDFNQDLSTVDGALGDHRTRIGTLEEKIAGMGNCGIHVTSRQGEGSRYTTYSIAFPEQPVFVIMMGAEGGVGFCAYGATWCTCSANGTVQELQIEWSGNTLTVHVDADASVGLNSNKLYYAYAILNAAASP